MATNVIKLPYRVFENDLFDFANQLNSFDDAEMIVLDITLCDYYIPSTILLLLGKLFDWHNNGTKVKLRYDKRQRFFKYLQRMNFFTFFEFDNEEKFKRHKPGDRFIPIVEFGVDSRTDQEIDKDPDILSKKLSDIAIRKNKTEQDPKVKQLKNGITYSCGELIMNVIQHSNGTGYAFAQYNEYMDYVRVAILDKGIGIKQSYKMMESEHYKEDMSDLEAIFKSLEYEVSSKPTGIGFENAGVGLTYLYGICQLAGVDMTIISNKGFYSFNIKAQNSTNFISGTLSSITLERSKLYEFNNVFKKAQNQ